MRTELIIITYNSVKVFISVQQPQTSPLPHCERISPLIVLPSAHGVHNKNTFASNVRNQSLLDAEFLQKNSDNRAALHQNLCLTLTNVLSDPSINANID